MQEGNNAGRNKKESKRNFENISPIICYRRSDIKCDKLYILGWVNPSKHLGFTFWKIMQEGKVKNRTIFTES